MYATAPNTADKETVAAAAAKPGPFSRANRNRIGPVSTGKPASQPATSGPQRLPASEMSSRNVGTRSSLTRIKAGAPRSGFGQYQRHLHFGRADAPVHAQG